MPSFLTNKIGPLPTWGWMLAGLGLVVAVTLRRRNAQGSTTLPTQSLNPDYGPGGWPGQGSLGAAPPLSALSQVSGTAFQDQSGGSGTGSSSSSSALNSVGNPLNRITGTIAASGPPPPGSITQLPR